MLLPLIWMESCRVVSGEKGGGPFEYLLKHVFRPKLDIDASAQFLERKRKVGNFDRIDHRAALDQLTALHKIFSRVNAVDCDCTPFSQVDYREASRGRIAAHNRLIIAR